MLYSKALQQYVTPAKAEVQMFQNAWMPAFAGMTNQIGQFECLAVFLLELHIRRENIYGRDNIAVEVWDFKGEILDFGIRSQTGAAEPHYI